MSVYACSDLHGNLNLYKQIADFLKPEDTVYFLGDAGDRGSHSWETIKEIYKNKQFIYLKGNHEDMFVRAAKEFIIDEVWGYDYFLLCQNGGEETINDWLNEDNRNEWVAAINNLPVRAEYTNKDGITFIMTHAGFTPNKKANILLEDLLWSREHFYDAWPEDEEKTIILHGHTPKLSLHKRLSKANYFFNDEYLLDKPGEGIYSYCDGHKICLDCHTIITGQTVLYDLNTYEEHIFVDGE